MCIRDRFKEKNGTYYCRELKSVVDGKDVYKRQAVESVTFLNRKNSDTDSIVWMREDSAAYCSGKGGKLHRCSLSRT